MGKHKINISPAQLNIIKLMMTGWEIGISGGINPRFWIQNGGIGKGGESKIISVNTFHSLYKKGLLKQAVYKYSAERYILTPRGRRTSL